MLTALYAPNFISVVIGGMLIAFLNPSTGIMNHMLDFFGLDRVAVMTDPRWFKTIYVLSGVWQGTGWGSVIYLAALSGVFSELHEAAARLMSYEDAAGLVYQSSYDISNDGHPTHSKCWLNHEFRL